MIKMTKIKQMKTKTTKIEKLHKRLEIIFFLIINKMELNKKLFIFDFD